MKLATFEVQGEERFGLVMKHPRDQDLWIFDPNRCEARLKLYSSKATSPLFQQTPQFLGQWPSALVDFLALGTSALQQLRSLERCLHGFLALGDEALFIGAAYPLAAVKLRAPIPRPRLFFGLVQNSPTFIRNDPQRVTANLYPQGHQRPQGSLLGPGDPVVVTPEMKGFSWTPEPGIIIGKQGINIAASDAKDYIAGYTLVMDLVHDRYMDQLREAAAGDALDWFEEATGSWLGKKSDAMGAMGPFLTTADEIANPYDLLLFSRQSGYQRDRAHTGAMMIGFERAISWLSSFMELQPGDVIHMGTMAFDGLFITEDMSFNQEDYIEGELEQVGRLRLPVVMQNQGDWRAEDDPSRLHSVPAARDLIRRDQRCITSWQPETTRHVWTVFANYHEVASTEGFKPRSLPRVLNAPASLLTISPGTITLPQRARNLEVGIELACVIKKLAYRIQASEAADTILGYSPLIALHDGSFAEGLVFPATRQEEHLPGVYGRWPDGFNVISQDIVALDAEQLRQRTMRLQVGEDAEIVTSTDEYILLAEEVITFLSQEITLFPGDVITLGRTQQRLTLNRPRDQHIQLRASIAGLAVVQASIENATL